MVLAADRYRSLQAAGRAGEGGVRIAAAEDLGGQDEAPGRERRAHIGERGQRIVFDARQRRSAPRGLVGRSRHTEERLPGVLHQVAGENRVVLEHRAVVVLAGHIRRGCNCHDARRGAHRGEVQRLDVSVRDGAHAQGRVQRAGRQRHVVHVERLAAHVQMCAFVRDLAACDRGRPDACGDIHVVIPANTPMRTGCPALQCSR